MQLMASTYRRKGNNVFIVVSRSGIEIGEIRITLRTARILYDAICLYDSLRASAKWKKIAKTIARKRKPRKKT